MPGKSLIDFGCGSGILSVAAALLFPGATITAVDNDELAVAATRENAERNGIGDRVNAALCADPAELAGGEFAPGLVCANIQRRVLLPAAAALTRLAAPSARLLLSGLLADQLDEVSDAYQARGWAERRRTLDPIDGAWGLLVLAR